MLRASLTWSLPASQDSATRPAVVAPSQLDKMLQVLPSAVPRGQKGQSEV